MLAGSFARRTTAIFGGEILFCANDRFTVNGLLDQIKASSTESVAHFRHESCWKQAHPTEIESVRSSVSSALTFGEGRFKTEKSIKEEKDFAVAAQAGQTSGGFGSGGIGRHGGPSGSGGSDSWASLFGRSVS